MNNLTLKVVIIIGQSIDIHSADFKTSKITREILIHLQIYFYGTMDILHQFMYKFLSIENLYKKRHHTFKILVYKVAHL